MATNEVSPFKEEVALPTGRETERFTDGKLTDPCGIENEEFTITATRDDWGKITLEVKPQGDHATEIFREGLSMQCAQDILLFLDKRLTKELNV